MTIRRKPAIAAVAALVSTLSVTAGAEAGGGIGGCYVRADVGHGWNVDDKGIARITPAFGTGIGPVENPDFASSWFGEIGLGCRLFRQGLVAGGSSKDGGSLKDAPAPMPVAAPSPLRGDITFGFHNSRKFHGEPLPPPAPPPNWEDPVSAKLHTMTLMFNGYVDLPRILGVTPYVGAGIGMAFHELEDVTFTNGFVIKIGSGNATNLAWSLMTGVSVDLGPRMVLDVGYRYLNTGDIEKSAPAIGYSLRIADTSQHQVKVGLRIPIGN
jgi:hypothetical protein